MGQEALKDEFSPPNVFAYTDARLFLNDLFNYFSDSHKSFSLRGFAEKYKLSQGHISKFLNGHATLTVKTLNKMMPGLDLSSEEAAFLHSLRDLSESKTQEDRVEAFKKILRNRRFKELNKQDIVEHEFLSQWYYPAIRELARLPEFKLDPKWIRQKLNNRLTVTEAKLATNFLLQHEYIFLDEDHVSVPEVAITCASGVYRLAASEYHNQLLSMARDSIHDVDRDLRQIMSQTIAMPKNKIVKVREILRRAVGEISEINEDGEPSDSVYQISLLAFPLTDAQNMEENE